MEVVQTNIHKKIALKKNFIKKILHVQTQIIKLITEYLTRTANIIII